MLSVTAQAEPSWLPGSNQLRFGIQWHTNKDALWTSSRYVQTEDDDDKATDSGMPANIATSRWILKFCFGSHFDNLSLNTLSIRPRIDEVTVDSGDWLSIAVDSNKGCHLPSTPIELLKGELLTWYMAKTGSNTVGPYQINYIWMERPGQ